MFLGTVHACTCLYIATPVARFDAVSTVRRVVLIYCMCNCCSPAMSSAPRGLVPKGGTGFGAATLAAFALADRQ